MDIFTISLEQYLVETTKLQAEISHLKEQIECFKKQIFGKKSEKIIERSANQTLLLELPKTVVSQRHLILREEHLPLKIRYFLQREWSINYD